MKKISHHFNVTKQIISTDLLFFKCLSILYKNPFILNVSVRSFFLLDLHIYLPSQTVVNRLFLNITNQFAREAII